jgi:EAL domain-containing protein (putative c-di-GMP-specific phosphodiesterase class I)
MNELAAMPDTVLVVDDEDAWCRVYSRLLRQAGLVVESAANGAQALDLLGTRHFQVIISDVHMPVYTGLEFLRAIRERDLDIPVILVTGQPDVASASEAVEYGAFRYLTKPVDTAQLLEVVRRACDVHRVTRLRREAWEILGKQGSELGDRASVDGRYELALSTLFLEFQAIVRPGERSVLGYEAFVSSSEPTLQRPEDLFAAAWRLGKVHALGRTVRQRLVEAAERAPKSTLFFVNLHPEELNDNELWSSTGALAGIADRVVLEISERSPLDSVSGLKTRLRRLRGLGFRIALEDVGIGHATLGSFSRVEPEFVKLDSSLTAGIETSARQLSIVNGMVEVCSKSLDISVIAESVETPSERAALTRVGVELFQGHYFARPARELVNPWAE